MDLGGFEGWLDKLLVVWVLSRQFMLLVLVVEFVKCLVNVKRQLCILGIFGNYGIELRY